jgi:hypothetical protein
MSGTPGVFLRRSATMESQQTLWSNCGQHTNRSTDPIYIEKYLAEDEKRTIDLPYCEITKNKKGK